MLAPLILAAYLGYRLGREQVEREEAEYREAEAYDDGAADATQAAYDEGYADGAQAQREDWVVVDGSDEEPDLSMN